MFFILLITAVNILVFAYKDTIRHSIGGLHRWLAKREANSITNLLSSVNFDGGAFFLRYFAKHPRITSIENIDRMAAYTYMDNTLKPKVRHAAHRFNFSSNASRQETVRHVFIFRKKVVVVLHSESADILYVKRTTSFADQLVKDLSILKADEKERVFKLTVNSQDNNLLEWKPISRQIPGFEIDFCYPNDFKAMDLAIQERLSLSSDRRIILLYGLPGRGKTSYIHHLAGEIEKEVFFIALSVAARLTDFEFIELLIDFPNAVWVIEDVEQLFLESNLNKAYSLANYLKQLNNLFSDFPASQIICSFNEDLSPEDLALLNESLLIFPYNV